MSLNNKIKIIKKKNKQILKKNSELDTPWIFYHGL